MQFSLTNAASKGQEMKGQKSEQSEKAYIQIKSSSTKTILKAQCPPEVKQFACAVVEAKSPALGQKYPAYTEKNHLH